MKKIGILTFHRAENYGAVLQAYALQYYLNLETDCTAEVIDYRSPFIEEYYKIFSINSVFSLNKWKRIAFTILNNGSLKSKRRIFDDFIGKNINMSTKSFDSNDVSLTNEIYDSFICGSDQIWSPYSAGFDETYFLTFIKDSSLKNSYAASFGVDKIPNNLKLEYNSRLEKFNHISVREEVGVRLVKELANKKSEVVLDPTLLLSKQQWKEIISDKSIIDRKYVLVYLIAETKEILSLAKKIAKEADAEVVYINDNIYKTKGVINFNNCSPEQWLNLFYYADYVVTNSFHGIAFSINFRKKFSVQYLPEPAKVNSRISNILSAYELNGRIDCDNYEELNYTIIEPLITKDIHNSKKFIEKIIGEI